MRTTGVVATALAGAIGLLGMAPLAAGGRTPATDTDEWAQLREEAIAQVAQDLDVTPQAFEAAGREVIATDLEEAAAEVRAGTETRAAPEQWLDPQWRAERLRQARAEFAADLAAELDLEPERVEQALEDVRRDGYESWGERLGRLLRERLSR